MAAVPDAGVPRVPQIDEGAPDAAERHTFIGSSEAFELLNEKQYGRGCARALAYRKLQMPEDVPSASVRDRAISMRAIMHRGNILEPIAARLYMDDTGRQLIRRSGLKRHPEFYGAGVHTDRIILASDRLTGDAEIKTHAEGPFLHILRDGLPPAHNLQLQWSLFCTGHSWGAFIILGVFGELPLKHFDVERDPALMSLFADATKNFWEGLKAAILPPRLSDATDIRCKVCPYRLTCRGEAHDPEAYRRVMAEREGKRVLTEIANDELDQALADRALILSEMQALDYEDDADPGALQIVTRRVKELLGDTEAALVNKHWKVYCSEHTWSGIDVQRLREEQPEIFKRYYIERRPSGTRRLRVYALHDGRNA